MKDKLFHNIEFPVHSADIRIRIGQVPRNQMSAFLQAQFFLKNAPQCFFFCQIEDKGKKPEAEYDERLHVFLTKEKDSFSNDFRRENNENEQGKIYPIHNIFPELGPKLERKVFQITA